MTDLIEVRVSNLSGEALGWAVGKAEGLDVYLEPPGYNGVPWRVFARYQGQATEHAKRFNPWEDWAVGGPLTGKYQIEFMAGDDNMEMHASLAAWRQYGKSHRTRFITGTNHLVAACRAVVATRIGDTALVPKELLRCPK
ncbi:hypothetical protein C206_20841 [Pseudomonas putida TRO1]|uniref:DUF2591 domain-containing protein n=1 Tax=Pseudomonas putida TRO1 TaxID=1227924 RepID=A0AAD2W745_PSEPU|nr:DUF2591 domain-containing protein [Pseudomonas putida]ENY75652.1 hypothetical protein C206_20841 [Pseudomonas putida TRO1]